MRQTACSVELYMMYTVVTCVIARPHVYPEKLLVDAQLAHPSEILGSPATAIWECYTLQKNTRFLGEL